MNLTIIEKRGIGLLSTQIYIHRDATNPEEN